MRQDLKGRVALVTGGSGGIGKALVAALAAAGSDVAVGYSSNEQAALESAEQARRPGVRAVAVQADLSEPTEAVGMVEDVEQLLGGVDLFVSNAGLGVQAGIEEIDAALWRATQAVNLESPILLTRRLTGPMAGRGFGRVLYVSSTAAFTGGIVGPHYASSKAGLQGLVAWFSSHLAERGVTVNAIAPALVERTAMLPASESDTAPTPVGRYGTPEEVAELALAMLANGYLTGKVVPLDGGLYPR